MRSIANLIIIFFLLILQCLFLSAQIKKVNNKEKFHEFDFPKDSNLLNSDYNKRIFTQSYFEGAEFRKFANFDSTVFNRYANFEEIIADKGISFRNDTFNDNFSLYRLAIPSGINFSGSVFKNNAQFERVSSDSCVDFSNCKISGVISFIDVIFKKMKFSNLTLKANATILFHNSEVKFLDFSFNPQINNEIRLIDVSGNYFPGSSKSHEICFINLYKSDISKFYLDYHNFKLYFPPYKDASNSVDSIEINFDEKVVIYEALLNNFKSHGQFDSYKLLDIEYRSFKYDSENHWFYEWLDRYWWNFGYNKEYIFKWTGYLLLLFTFINMFLVNRLNNWTYTIASIPKKSLHFYSLKTLEGLIRNIAISAERFWYSLIYTAAIFFKITLKIENFKFTNKFEVIYLFIIYLSGLICLAYLANFVIQK